MCNFDTAIWWFLAWIAWMPQHHRLHLVLLSNFWGSLKDEAEKRNLGKQKGSKEDEIISGFKSSLFLSLHFLSSPFSPLVPLLFWSLGLLSFFFFFFFLSPSLLLSLCCKPSATWKKIPQQFRNHFFWGELSLLWKRKELCSFQIEDKFYPSNLGVGCHGCRRFITRIIVVITVLGVLMTESKSLLSAWWLGPGVWRRESKWFLGLITFDHLAIHVCKPQTNQFGRGCLFHMEAVGRWDHGHPYKFSYALTLTMTVFLLMLGLSWTVEIGTLRDGFQMGPCTLWQAAPMLSGRWPWLHFTTWSNTRRRKRRHSWQGCDSEAFNRNAWPT